MSHLEPRVATRPPRWWEHLVIAASVIAPCWLLVEAFSVSRNGVETYTYLAQQSEWLYKMTLLVIGAEASGVESAWIEAADEHVRIPLQVPVESLNAAVAAGVLLFEAQRQRAAP